jgi:hypothetical protein
LVNFGIGGERRTKLASKGQSFWAKGHRFWFMPDKDQPSPALLAKIEEVLTEGAIPAHRMAMKMPGYTPDSPGDFYDDCLARIDTTQPIMIKYAAYKTCSDKNKAFMKVKYKLNAGYDKPFDVKDQAGLDAAIKACIAPANDYPKNDWSLAWQQLYTAYCQDRALYTKAKLGLTKNPISGEAIFKHPSAMNATELAVTGNFGRLWDNHLDPFVPDDLLPWLIGIGCFLFVRWRDKTRKTKTVDWFLK